jgi:hypothetical protein
VAFGFWVLALGSWLLAFGPFPIIVIRGEACLADHGDHVAIPAITKSVDLPLAHTSY